MTFVSEGGGKTRVDLEHRHIERAGTGARAVRTAVEGPQGWPGMLQLFSDRVTRGARGDLQPQAGS